MCKSQFLFWVHAITADVLARDFFALSRVGQEVRPIGTCQAAAAAPADLPDRRKRECDRFLYCAFSWEPW
jgi:hypothetical protein